MKLFDAADNSASAEVSGQGHGNSALLNHLVFLAIFGYFAFGYSEEPTSYSTSNSEDFIKFIPYFDGDSEGYTVDVA